MRIAASALAVGLLAAAGCNRAEKSSSAETPKAGSAVTATAPATPAELYAKLHGRWLRPDGGYVLMISAVDSEGRADAKYFNPNPINVAWARVRTDGPRVRLEVELRDTNYPGCLYKLNYLPETDRLVGTYFQAQMQETHEVAFVREP
ncbi:MAG: hypothetical protein Q7S40_08420 [Opitutaceae bacterium]|nr:hypothetical protein [Opitutaceae bacterium]